MNIVESDLKHCPFKLFEVYLKSGDYLLKNMPSKKMQFKKVGLISYDMQLSHNGIWTLYIISCTSVYMKGAFLYYRLVGQHVEQVCG